MKKIVSIVVFLTLYINGFTQIYAPEGLNIPGVWNGWTNPPTNNLAIASSQQVSGGRVTKILTGTARWQTIIKVASSGGDMVGGAYDWVFTSGASGSPWNNKWGALGTVTLNTLQNYTYGGGVSNNTITIANGKWYTMNWKDVGYANTSAIFMETSAAPVSIDNVVQIPTSANVFPGQSVVVNITTSASPAAEEKVYVRYSTDNFATSVLLLASFTGNEGTVTIPAFSGTVKYYVFSTTINSPSADYDLYTITLNNNGGSNYSYSVNSSWITNADGNWSSTSTWLGGVVPVSGQPVIINHNVTLGQNASVSSLIINSGKTFTASDNNPRTLTITKSTSGSATTLSNSGTWQNGSGVSTVIFTGATSGNDAVHAITGTIAFQNITVNKTGGTPNVGVSFGASSSVSGTLEIGSGGFISTAPPTSFYGTNAILKFNTGTSYNVGATDNSWSTVEIPNFITISSGTVNLNASRIATGNLIIDGGTLVLNAPLTIQGDWTRSSGTFTPNSQTVTLSGSASNTVINTATDAVLYDLVVNKSGGKTVSLSSNLTVNHDLTVSGGVLTVPSTIGLTVSGILTNNVASGIVLESPLNSGAPGSLIANGTVGGTGTLKAERYISAYSGPANGWHLLSSPVNYQWLDQKVGANNITTMVNGNGYLVAYQTAATKYITGTPNNSALTLTNLTKTTGKGEGWHLLGNPFTSAIKWNNGSYAISGIGLVAKLMGNMGGYTDISENSIIPAMQGFFVQAVSATNAITIPLNARIHDATSWMKSTENSHILLTANDLESQMAQESWVRVNDQATSGYDYQYDSHFMPLYAPQFYSLAGDEKLSTNSLPSLPAESLIPFGFVKNDASSFSIELKESIDGYQVFLKDLKTNMDQNLTENPVYTFTSEANDDTNRFLLHFLSTVGTSNPVLPTTSRIYISNRNIYIEGLDAKAEILVRNMLGQVVASRNANGTGAQVINTANLTAGVYVVSVVTGNQVRSEKVVIK